MRVRILNIKKFQFNFSPEKIRTLFLNNACLGHEYKQIHEKTNKGSNYKDLTSFVVITNDKIHSKKKNNLRKTGNDEL